MNRIVYDYHCKIFMHNIVHKCPECFRYMFSRSLSNRTNNIVIEKCKNKFLTQFPSNILPSKWNELSLDLKRETSMKKFKENVFSSILDSYCPNESCNRVNCPDCRR